MSDELEDWSEPPYQVSGLICEKCGHDDSIQCRLWNSDIGDDELLTRFSMAAIKR